MSQRKDQLARARIILSPPIDLRMTKNNWEISKKILLKLPYYITKKKKSKFTPLHQLFLNSP